MSVSYAYLESPIGELLISAERVGLRQILFPNGGRPARPDPAWQEDATALADVIRQLKAYFAGELESFALTVSPQGTPFQQRVWSELQKIP